MAVLSVYPRERKGSIRDITPVWSKWRQNGLRPNRKYFILLEKEIRELLD
jgi:hypothetical protein